MTIRWQSAWYTVLLPSIIINACHVCYRKISKKVLFAEMLERIQHISWEESKDPIESLYWVSFRGAEKDRTLTFPRDAYVTLETHAHHLLLLLRATLSVFITLLFTSCNREIVGVFVRGKFWRKLDRSNSFILALTGLLVPLAHWYATQPPFRKAKSSACQHV